MVKNAEICFGKWVPDMHLYHRENIHSRLALLGLLAGGPSQSQHLLVGEVQDRVDDWKNVERSKKISQVGVTSEDILLKESDSIRTTSTNKNIEEELTLFKAKQSGHRRSGPQDLFISNDKSACLHRCGQCNSVLESQGLLKAHISQKHNAPENTCEHCGLELMSKLEMEKHVNEVHTRITCMCDDCKIQFSNTNELDDHNNRIHKGITYTCEECDVTLLTKTDLQNHMRLIHRKKKFTCDTCEFVSTSEVELQKHIAITHRGKSYACEQCELVLTSETELQKHIEQKHIDLDEWNCCDCSFQTNEAAILVQHLKVTGHQPSKNLEKKKLFTDYKQCYTCKMDFDGYYNLMEHRKLVHPSKKKCRYFPDTRVHDASCWYVHEEPEPMDVDVELVNKEWNFKCNFCEEAMKERREFMLHKKTKHGETVLNCEKFLRGECKRNVQSCWFKHPVQNPGDQISMEQVFHQAQPNPPPDPMSTILKMISKLFQKIETLESNFQHLKQ